MKHLVLLPSGASASSLQLRSSRSAAAAAPARPRRQRGAARHRHLAVAAAPADGARSDAAGQNVQQNAAVAGDATADAGSQPGAQGSTAAAGEQPAVQQAAPARSQRWRAMLLSCWRLLQRSLWPLVVAHGVTDALVFLLHRLSHRATNEVAVRLLGGGLLTPAAIGNMWWLNTDPAIANFKTGYQLLTFAFFLLAFPLNVAIKTWASCATILLCRRAQQQPEEEEQAQAQQQQTAAAAQGEGPATEAGQAAAPAEENGAVPQAGAAPWWNVRRGLRQAFGTLRSINGEVAALWRPVFIVELLVAAVVVPAQFASLAVITLPFTLPLIVELQAAGPAAALEGVRGTAAMARSRALLRGLRWQLAVPFVGLVVAGRLLEGAKAALLSNLPPRFYQELVELPLLVLVGGTLLSILLARMQDVLPMVAYAEGKQAEAVAAAQAGASQGASNGASGKGSQGASNGASGGDGGSK